MVWDIFDFQEFAVRLLNLLTRKCFKEIFKEIVNVQPSIALCYFRERHSGTAILNHSYVNVINQGGSVFNVHSRSCSLRWNGRSSDNSRHGRLNPSDVPAFVTLHKFLNW